MNALILAAETADVAGPATVLGAVAAFVVAVTGFLKVMTDRKDANSVTAASLQRMDENVRNARADKVQAEANEAKALAALEAKTQEVDQCNQRIRELEQLVWRLRKVNDAVDAFMSDADHPLIDRLRAEIEQL